MKKKILYFIIVAITIIAIDAIAFKQRNSMSPEEIEKVHKEISIFLDNKPDISAKCINVNGKCLNSIYATCWQLACQAKEEGCNGDYSSGNCKAIKDAHDGGLCSTLSSSDCGKTLPRDLYPKCSNWWNYLCRIKLLYRDMVIK